MSPSKFLPKYNQLSTIEKFWFRTCFKYSKVKIDKTEANRSTTLSKTFEDSEYLFKKAFGKDVFEDFKGRHILDFGCGEGYFAYVMAQNSPETKIMGIDIQERFRYIENHAHGNNVTICNFF